MPIQSNCTRHVQNMNLPPTLALIAIFLCSRASAVEFSEAHIGGKRVTVCRVNVRKERLQLCVRDDSGQLFRRFERLSAWLEPRHQKLVFAMNAGMYQRD